MKRQRGVVENQMVEQAQRSGNQPETNHQPEPREGSSTVRLKRPYEPNQNR
jgi:hypothetical protein